MVQGFNIVDKLLGFTLLGSEWVLWLLIFLSVLSIAIVIERIVFYSRTKTHKKDFWLSLSDKLANGQTEEISILCKNRLDLESKLTLKGLELSTRGAKAMDEAMSGTIITEKHELDRGLMILGTLGNNAPFVGLFGTVIGIIKAFNDLAANPAGGPAVVMAGISEALVATAVGLMVAIPAVVAYNGFLRIVKSRMANAEAVKKLILTHYTSGA